MHFLASAKPIPALKPMHAKTSPKSGWDEVDHSQIRLKVEMGQSLLTSRLVDQLDLQRACPRALAGGRGGQAGRSAPWQAGPRSSSARRRRPCTGLQWHPPL